MEARKQLEREFHNNLRRIEEDERVAETRWSRELETTIATNPLWSNMKYYSIERSSRRHVLKWLEKNCRGKRVLDYCCGNGHDGVYVAQHGARHVVGIDISEVSIENSRRLAARNGVDGVTEYIIADAENTELPHDSFDIITEYGSLHHLDLDKTFQEMARVLRPDGQVICNEALGHNPLIRLYRKMTPSLRTPWEVDHIMRKHSFRIARRYFKEVDLHFYHLATLLAVPLRNFRGFSATLKMLEVADAFLLRVPLLKWQAWQVVFTMSGPRKDKVHRSTGA